MIGLMDLHYKLSRSPSLNSKYRVFSTHLNTSIMLSQQMGSLLCVGDWVCSWYWGRCLHYQLTDTVLPIPLAAWPTFNARIVIFEKSQFAAHLLLLFLRGGLLFFVNWAHLTLVLRLFRVLSLILSLTGGVFGSRFVICRIFLIVILINSAFRHYLWFTCCCWSSANTEGY